jgi:hypothetical protein
MEKRISSGLRTTFLVHFIVGLLFGLLYLLTPQVWGRLSGWPMQDPVVYRLVGAALLGFAASSWWAYQAATWESVKIVVQTEIVWTVLATLILLWGLIFVDLPPLFWLNAATLAAFSVAWVVFYFRG